VARATRASVLAAVVALSIAGGGLAIVRAGDIVGYAGDRWTEFKSTKQSDDYPGVRLTQHGSDKRYDYWRVALDTVRDAPVGGAGAGGFEHEYTPHRRFAKPSRSAHSIWMRSLAETGLVGAGLFVGFTVFAGAGLLRARRRLDDAGRGIVAASAAVAAYFLGHASLDWLELMPALAAPAVALPFVALRLAAPSEAVAQPSGATPLRRRLGAAAGIVLVVAALAVLALPYLSLRYVDSALRHSRSDPAGADRDLDRATSLNPLSTEPHLARGRIALSRRDYAAARRAYERALEVEDTWYPHFELALLDARERRFAGARREIAAARALNPPDPLMAQTAELIAKRIRIDPASIDRDLIERLHGAGAPG
jgi:O-antigen ligase/polysaccharide polymerase Wzy-like membrane protein